MFTKIAIMLLFITLCRMELFANIFIWRPSELKRWGGVKCGVVGY